MGPTLAAALQVEAVRLVQAPEAVHIELPSPIQRTPQATELVRHTRHLTVCVGYNSLRQPVHIDLTQHGAVFWIGPSRRGKTQAMKATLYSLASANGSRLKYVILCHKGKRQHWQAFAQAAGCMGIVTDPAEHEQVLAWASGPLLEWQTPFQFLVVCDDLLNLLENADLAAPLGNLASIGAGLGVHLLAGTQEAGSTRGSGGGGVETNMTAKVLYKPSSSSTGARNAGQKGVELHALTAAKGDALLLVDGYGQRIATGFADDRDILQLPTDNCLLAPWRAQTPVADASTSRVSPDVYTSTDADTVPAATSGTAGVLPTPSPHAKPQNTLHVGVDPRTSTKLPDQEPNAAERVYLRQLMQQYGSKNKVLEAAWGGVINQSGKTPKTWAWLRKALEEGEHRPEVGAPTCVPAIDMNTPEGQAAVDLLIARGLLPRDTLTNVVTYAQ
jgi:hypothetical protein